MGATYQVRVVKSAGKKAVFDCLPSGAGSAKCLPTLEGFLSELIKKLADDRIADRDIDRVEELVERLLAIVKGSSPAVSSRT